MKTLKIFLLSIIAIYLIAWCINNAYTIVDGGKGEAGIRVTMGHITPKTYLNGPVFRVPFISYVDKMNIRQQAYSSDTMQIKTKNFQEVSFSCVIICEPNKNRVHELYANVGKEYQPVILTPLIEDAVKEVIGKYNIQFLVESREKVREAALYIVKDQLAKDDLLQVKDFRFQTLKFSPEFEKMAEEVALADLSVKKATFETDRVTQEAKQNYLRLEAAAKAAGLELKLKSEALKNPLIINYELMKAIQKWDGKLNLPSTLMTGSNGNSILPIIPVNPVTNNK